VFLQVWKVHFIKFVIKQKQIEQKWQKYLLTLLHFHFKTFIQKFSFCLRVKFEILFSRKFEILFSSKLFSFSTRGNFFFIYLASFLLWQPNKNARLLIFLTWEILFFFLFIISQWNIVIIKYEWQISIYIYVIFLETFFLTI